MSANKGGQRKGKRAGSASAEPSTQDWKVTIPCFTAGLKLSEKSSARHKRESRKKKSPGTGARVGDSAAKLKIWRLRCGVSGKNYELVAPSRKEAREAAKWLGLRIMDDYEVVTAFDERGWL